MVILSTHDIILIPLAVAFGLIDINCLKQDFENGTNICEVFPPFASNFIFELYKISDNKYEI